MKDLQVMSMAHTNVKYSINTMPMIDVKQKMSQKV
jgi:hypothetical protein